MGLCDGALRLFLGRMGQSWFLQTPEPLYRVYPARHSRPWTPRGGTRLSVNLGINQSHGGRWGGRDIDARGYSPPSVWPVLEKLPFRSRQSTIVYAYHHAEAFERFCT